MRIQIIFERRRTINRAAISALVHKEIFLKPMSEKELVDKIIFIIETTGIQVKRKDHEKAEPK